MKRYFCLLMALFMMCCGLTLSSCTNEPVEVPIPEGYQVYDNGAISFAYPEGWTKTDGSTVILTNPDGSGNNITVVYENKTDLYATMDVEGFNDKIKPSLEAAGMSVSNVSVTQTENAGGFDLTKMSYSASFSGVNMTQTLYILNTKDKTYVVTITETTPDTALKKNVLDTLKTVK